MLFDPVSAIVVASAIGVSSLVRNRDDQILRMIESRFAPTLSEPYRIVLERGDVAVAASAMILADDS